MSIKVSEQGVLIPKQLLEGIEEVEIRKENNIILIIPVRIQDPIVNLGKFPVDVEITDASIDPDCYIYDL